MTVFRGITRSDLALVLVFCIGLPLTAGGWWRYFSGYGHPWGSTMVEHSAAAATAVAPQGRLEPARRAGRVASRVEKETPLLAWTTGAEQQQGPTAGQDTSLSGNEAERK